MGEAKHTEWNPFSALSVHLTLLPEEELEKDSSLLCKINTAYSLFREYLLNPYYVSHTVL